MGFELIKQLLRTENQDGSSEKLSDDREIETI